jgi:hypothetical protein
MMLFDYVKCEYPLPVPDELKGSKTFKPEKIEFQTFSMPPASLDEYEITDDGQVYLWKIEKEVVAGKYGPEIKEKSRELEKQDYSGEMTFGAVHLAKKYDYWVQYKILFWKGEVKEVRLMECDKEDNSSRLNAQKKLLEFVKEETEKQDKWWYKVHFLYVLCVRRATFCSRWILGWGIKLTWKIERWLM